jgi:peptidylprolyl isomerase
MKGIRTKDLKIGDGGIAEEGMMAVVRYDCFLPQGERCDVGSLYIAVGEDRNTFPAITHGVLGMAVGGIREIKVAPQLAYYERRKNPNIPESAALRYEVTLLSLESPQSNT